MPERSSRPSGGLAPSALRGLLDATPAAVGCFDAALRVVYANTAFTMVTGAQTGRTLDEGPLATEVRELIASTDTRRRVRIGGERRMPISGTLFTLEDGLIVHERRVYDFTGMLVQIGLLKAKPA